MDYEKRLSKAETSYDDDIKLLAKFKPNIIERIIWWFVPMQHYGSGFLRFEVDQIHNKEVDNETYLKAYYAKRELDRRERKQEKFIENLKRK